MNGTPTRQLHHSSLAAGRRLADAATRRIDGTRTWILVVELFLGLGWARAFVEKLIDPAWWSGDALRSFVTDHDGMALDWFEPLLTGVVVPLAVPVSLVVLVLEGVAAVSFLTGRHRSVGLASGVVLNLTFLAAGAVNPSAFYLVLQGALAVTLVERSDADLRRALFGVEVVVLTTAVMSATSIRTVHPARVIEDAAVMVITLAALTVLAAELVLRQSPRVRRADLCEVCDRATASPQVGAR